jgi:hypothetical protein
VLNAYHAQTTACTAKAVARKVQGCESYKQNRAQQFTSRLNAIYRPCLVELMLVEKAVSQKRMSDICGLAREDLT